MSFFSSWIVSIIAVALVITIIEIVLPNGNLQKFIKGILGVFMLLIMTTPLMKIKDIKLNYESQITTSNDYINQDILDKINEQQVKIIQNSIVQSLKESGFFEVGVEICYNSNSSELKIEKIILDATNLVINQNIPHINKYTEMKTAVKKVVAIEESEIEINE